MTTSFPTDAKPLVLAGTHVRLRPLSEGDVAGLTVASSRDRTTYGYTMVPTDEASTQRYVEQLLRERTSGTSYAFVIEDAHSAEILGMTRYLTIRWWFAREAPDAVEIGGTWLASHAQRTGVNTQAKRLLLAHAFEEWGVARVDFKSDVRNERSRRAIERLGATFEGVLYAWQPSQHPGEEGLPRDTAMYSIVRSRWPALRERLDTLSQR